MPKYDILILEINNEVVEEIRIFGKNNIKATVEEFKKAYNLSKGDDYVFYLILQSKMNRYTQEKNILNLKQ